MCDLFIELPEHRAQGVLNIHMQFINIADLRSGMRKLPEHRAQDVPNIQRHEENKDILRQAMNGIEMEKGNKYIQIYEELV